jgi:hypothetical protein
MRKLRAFASALLIVALAGCRAVWPVVSVEKPLWVDTPAGEGDAARFLSVTGVVGPGGPEQQPAEEAERAARENLARALSDYTRQALTSFLQAHPEYPPGQSPQCQEFAAMLTAEVAGIILRQSIKQDLWEGPDGKAYVLYRLPYTVVHDEIVAKMRYSIRHINPFGEAAERAVSQMQSFLDARQRDRLTAAAVSRPETPETPPEQVTPRWLEADRHEAYPSDKFLTAIGLGADLESAERAARTELAGRLSTDLAQLVQRVRMEERGTPLARELPWVDPMSLTFADGDLVADRIAEQWHDPVTETYYTLVVLDRDTAAAVCRAEMTKAQELAAGLRASARNHEKAENLAASLKDYADALAAACGASRWQLKAAVMAPPARAAQMEAISREPLLAQVKEDLQSLLRSVTVDKAGGDRQWLPPGVPPRAPLQVRVTGQGGKPVAGLLISFVLGEETGITGSALTDANGVAEWRMQQPLAAGLSTTVTAALDLKGLSPRSDLFRLTMPSASFEYVLRSRQNARLAVLVRERAASNKMIPASLADDVRQALSAEGFRLVPENESASYPTAADVSIAWSDSRIVEAFSGLKETVGPDAFLLIVVGEIEVRPESSVKTDRGRLYVVYCPFTIRVLDGSLPGEQKTVLTVSGKGRGGYLEDESEAARRARAEASAEATAQLVSGLREKLGPAGAP